MGRLSATSVKAATRPGRLGDGDGLYLVVTGSGTKSWMVRVQKHGTRRDFGLGSASKVSLAVARERAREIRTWVELGLDPLFERAEGARGADVQGGDGQGAGTAPQDLAQREA